MQEHRCKQIFIAFLLAIAVISISACSVLPWVEGTPTPEPTALPVIPQAVEEVVMAETEFRVTLPSPLLAEQTLSLEILDEVTGLALNAQRHAMEKIGDSLYSVKIPINAGSVVKYRYFREGAGPRAVEYASSLSQVRYRMVLVQTPVVVEDIITGWADQPFSGAYGRIQGRVLEIDTNLPVVGSLVTAGGQQTLTASDGSFILDALPPGKHNLVIYSLDGSFPPFQQEALVAAESSTPAEIRLNPAKYVNVTFQLTAPADIPESVPLRLVGNIYPLGNTFADLRGGVSTIASRAPTLTYLGEHQYRITVRLPAGLDLRYKFTLGDGFWNAERAAAGRLNTRQLIVPDSDITLDETLPPFTTPGTGAVTFNVTLSPSALLDADEVLSIQFNPYGWTEPIPMWPMGENRWIYTLYTPLDGDILGNTGYRFCKNDQCGIADDAATTGLDVSGKIFKPTADTQVITYELKKWAWQSDTSTPLTVTSDPIQPKGADFLTGVELLPDYHPSWQAYIGPAFDQLKRIQSQMVILSPTWHFTTVNPPVTSSVPGQDSSWYDLSRMAILAREKGLKIAIHPTLAYYQPSDLWWMEARRDTNWWQSWFDRYEVFVLNHADFAAQVGAEALILGDPTLRPALPGGNLADGNPSGVPELSAERWNTLIANIRSRYSGKLIWRIDYPAEKELVPEFVANMDQIYVVFSGKIGDYENPTKDDIRNAVKGALDNEILQLRDRFNKPVILGIAYPSADGVAVGCARAGDTCMPGYVFEQPGLDLPSVQQDLAEQSDTYNAILEAVNQNDWLVGVIASGYYPAAAIEDKSYSIRGKPALDIVWFWFSHFLTDASAVPVP